jgi:type IV secretion system protein VirB10
LSDQNPGVRPLAAAPSQAQPSWFTRRRIVAISILGTGVFGLLAWLIFAPRAPKPEPVKPPSHAAQASYEPPKATPVVAAVPVQNPPAPAPPSFVPPPPPAPPSFTSEKKAAPSRPAVYTFGGSGQSMPEYMKPKAPPAPPAPGPTTSIAYKSATVPGAKSMTIADRSLLLMPGPLVCIMDTTINTDVAGPFQCHLERDAVSPTNVVLMEKGTKVQGGYTSAVTQGQSRVIAVTANAITPNGVVVPLGGPIADQLGAAGVEGSVDNHWAARLGGALLLSLVDSGFALAQTELQKAGSTNLNISTGSGVSSLASQLLAKTINIPPTITLNQGTTVALWNTGIIDFGPSYRLEMSR